MDHGDLVAACPKLEQSFQLSPRLGTMLNLGACYERSGKLARALGIYEHAATMAHEAGRIDRESSARELAAAVEPRVAKLVLVVEDPPPGLVVEVDGEVLTTQGGLAPLDPGSRQLSARAPGHRPWTSVVVARAGATSRVMIPRLNPLDAEAPPPDSSTAPPPLREVPAEPTPRTANSSTLRTIGIVGGAGLAVAGVAAGTVFGLRARSLRDQSNGRCDATGCDARGESLLHDAMASGNWSTASFIAAGAGVVVCVAAWLLGAPEAPSKAVSLGPNGATLGARW
jgi:hypothetical protein